MDKKKPSIYAVFAAAIVVVTAIVFGVLLITRGPVKVTLDSEYQGASEQLELGSPESYEELIADKKSFIVFIDQAGCTTADRLRGFMKDYSEESEIKYYHFMWEQLRKSTLHDNVKYYPSIAIISKGKVVDFLKADSDDDAKYYNNYDDLKNWLDSFIK